MNGSIIFFIFLRMNGLNCILRLNYGVGFDICTIFSGS